MNVQLLLASYGTSTGGGGGGGPIARQSMYVGGQGIPIFVLESTNQRQWFGLSAYVEEYSAAAGGGGSGTFAGNATDAVTAADAATSVVVDGASASDAASATDAGTLGTIGGRQSMIGGGIFFPDLVYVLEAATAGKQEMINGTFVNEKV